MNATMTDAVPSAAKPVSEMTLVEIAEQLERVTSWIEVQRVREREARMEYQKVATEVEANVHRIREYANQLVAAQQRKTSAFDGLLGRREEPRPMSQRPHSANGRAHVHTGQPPKNLGEAILSLWSSGYTNEALTTEEISAGLPKIGYTSNAAPASLKSSINQALAKLCRTGKVIRFRSDGSRIAIRDLTSRARKYLAAFCLPEGEEV